MELTAHFQHVEPDILPIDFEGTHMILTGTRAFFYRLFKWGYGEERAQKELYPFLLEEKQKKEKAVSASTQDTAQKPERATI